MSRICCGICHVELEYDDLIVMDKGNCLRHKDCYNIEPDFTNPEYIKDTDTYKNLMEKYSFYCANLIH